MKSIILAGAILSASQLSLAKECVNFNGTYQLKTCSKKTIKDMMANAYFMNAPGGEYYRYGIASRYDLDGLEDGHQILLSIEQDNCKKIEFFKNREHKIGSLDLTKRTDGNNRPHFNVNQKQLVHVEKDGNYELVPLFYEPMMRNRRILTLSEDRKKLKIEDKWRYMAVVGIAPIRVEVKTYECSFDRVE